MLGTDPSIQAITFGTILRRLRKQVGISQEDLVFETELQSNYVSLMELGRYQPSITSIFKVAHALKMKPSALVLELENELIAQAKNMKRK